MNRQQAIVALSQGKVLTHEFFLDGEYVYMDLKTGEIRTEDGQMHAQFHISECFKTGLTVLELHINPSSPAPINATDLSKLYDLRIKLAETKAEVVLVPKPQRYDRFGEEHEEWYCEQGEYNEYVGERLDLIKNLEAEIKVLTEGSDNKQGGLQTP